MLSVEMQEYVHCNIQLKKMVPKVLRLVGSLKSFKLRLSLWIRLVNSEAKSSHVFIDNLSRLSLPVRGSQVSNEFLLHCLLF